MGNLFSNISEDSKICATEEVELRKQIKDANPTPYNRSTYNILLLGQIRAGKSSFYNTTHCAITGEFLETAPVRNEDTHITTQYRVRQLRGTHIKLCDTMGFNDVNAISQEQVKKLLKGELPDRFKFQPKDEKEITENTTLMSKRTNKSIEANKIHAVVFVIDGNYFDKMTQPNKKFLIETNIICNNEEIPVVALVTHLDEFSSEVEQNVLCSYAKRNTKVQGKFCEIKNFFGINAMWVLPVVNYTDTLESDWKKNFLALKALLAMVSRAKGYLEDKAEIGNNPD